MKTTCSFYCLTYSFSLNLHLYTNLQDTPEESTTDPQTQSDGGGTPNTYVDLLPETVGIYF